MKKIISLIIVIFTSIAIYSQSDTIIHFKNNKITLSESKDGEVKVKVSQTPTDSVENILFEGIYNETSRAEITFIYPLARVIPSYKIQNRSIYDFIFCSYYVGVSNLSSRTLQFIDNKVGPLNLWSYEFGLTLLGMDIPVAPQKGWSSFVGLTLRSLLYFPENNDMGYKIVNNQLTQVKEPNGIDYKDCQFSLLYTNIPMMFEWRKIVGKKHKNKFYIQTGFDLGVLLSAYTITSWNIDKDIVMSETIKRKRLHVNPISLDFKTEIGFDFLSLYLRYGLIETFNSKQGLKAIPVSLGIAYKI